LGVILIIFGASRADQTPTATESTEADEELQVYQSQLEDRIKQLCKSVDGVGDVTVVVTLEGGFTSVYATEYQNGNESYVIVGSGSSAKPLFLSREAPEIAGVGIVCKGGADASVRHELTVLISAAFHISSNRIYITAAA
jgi:stage III sporulation protein AG